MIYDSFTITVLATLENLGFCKVGDGGSFVSDGRIRLGGALPVNPDGGGLSSNHPGMRGIFLVIEAVKQLRGECDARQVDGAQLACVHGTGGTLGVGPQRRHPDPGDGVMSEAAEFQHPTAVRLVGDPRLVGGRRAGRDRAAAVHVVRARPAQAAGALREVPHRHDRALRGVRAAGRSTRSP